MLDRVTKLIDYIRKYEILWRPNCIPLYTDFRFTQVPTFQLQNIAQQCQPITSVSV
jgi:hypothetical protein